MLRKVLPFLEWLPDTTKQSLRTDAMAGLTVALVSVPQSVAYAQLAGIPPQYGLYASLLPPVVAALFGSSRQMSTGPAAVTAMITATSLQPLATAGSEAYLAYVAILSLLVGLVQFLLGALRLGVVVNLLSHPVVVGFTNAAAVVVATSQIPKLLGAPVDPGRHYAESLWHILQAFQRIHWPTLAFGLAALFIMVGLRRFWPKSPAYLVALLLTGLASWLGGYERDLTVPLSDLRSPHVQALLADYERGTGNVMSAVRAVSMSPDNLQAIESAHGAICTQCHVQAWPQAKPSDKSIAESGETALSADKNHLGLDLSLLSGHLQAIEAKNKALRETLRGLELVFVEAPTELSGFYLPDEVPTGGRLRGSSWRIRVPSQPGSLTELVLHGGGTVVGKLPCGLPSLQLPKFDGVIPWKDLILTALVVSLLGFMEAISIAKSLAAKSHQRIDPNRELIGQGLANVVSGLARGFPVSGSFVRSVLNLESGARSGLSSVFGGVVVLAVVLFLTPLLHPIPQSVLAAVIMVAVASLFRPQDFLHCWRVQPADGVIALLSFVATLAFAPHLDKGILVGVVLTIAMFLNRNMHPNLAELSLWTDGSLRDADRHGLAHCRHICVLRLDGPLFFANAGELEQRMLGKLAANRDLRAFLLFFQGVNELDASGATMLENLLVRVREEGADVYVCGLREQMMEVFQRSGLVEALGADHFFYFPSKALDAIYERTHTACAETACPLRQVVPAAGASGTVDDKP